jgi:hypothetical protein
MTAHSRPQGLLYEPQLHAGVNVQVRGLCRKVAFGLFERYLSIMAKRGGLDRAVAEAARRRRENQQREAPAEIRPAPPARPARVGGGNNRWDALQALLEAARAEAAAAAARDRAVRRARAAGASWVDIGAALGCTPQAAGQRYGR